MERGLLLFVLLDIIIEVLLVLLNFVLSLLALSDSSFESRVTLSKCLDLLHDAFLSLSKRTHGLLRYLGWNIGGCGREGGVSLGNCLLALLQLFQLLDNCSLSLLKLSPDLCSLACLPRAHSTLLFVEPLVLLMQLFDVGRCFSLSAVHSLKNVVSSLIVDSLELHFDLFEFVHDALILRKILFVKV